MSSRPEHPLMPLFRKLSKWAELDGADEAAVLALPYSTRFLSGSSYLIRDGEKAVNCGLLISGFAFRSKIAGNGGRQILSIHMRGDVVDLQSSLLRTADHNVQALTEVEVAMIPRDAVRELAFARPAIGTAMWRDTLVDASVHREWTTNVGRRDAQTRIAHLLCEFGVRLEAAGLGELCEYELPITQEELADCTGLTPVHVNRTLKALDSEGLTERHKRAVRIIDFRKLADAGDFNSAYLHLPR